MRKWLLCICCLCCLNLFAEEKSPQICVAVLDFYTIDSKGQKLLDVKSQPSRVQPQETLNKEDRKSINSVMQGFVRMIDAWDNSKTKQSDRLSERVNDKREWEKAKALYETTVKGVSRPSVIGADYLEAYLGARNDCFRTVDAKSVENALTKLQSEPGFPKNIYSKIAAETGATHLIYGTVSDVQSSESTFKGYGVESKNRNYSLDVILKVVDLVRGNTVYSRVYTGNYTIRETPGVVKNEKNIYEKLMKAALQDAADDLYSKAKPGADQVLSIKQGEKVK